MKTQKYFRNENVYIRLFSFSFPKTKSIYENVYLQALRHFYSKKQKVIHRLSTGFTSSQSHRYTFSCEKNPKWLFQISFIHKLKSQQYQRFHGIKRVIHKCHRQHRYNVYDLNFMFAISFRLTYNVHCNQETQQKSNKRCYINVCKLYKIVAKRKTHYKPYRYNVLKKFLKRFKKSLQLVFICNKL